jgi:SulP family sulfate permease
MTPYDRKNFSGDLSAGLTVGVMLIPQGMAYAMLAGLPPIYGLYASTIPLIVYALFGTSRQLAVGPVAMVALLISSGVGALAEIGSAEFVAMAILLALMVGLIQLAMGVFRLGFLVNFLSHPVIAGFTSAAALIIGFSQLKHLLGISIPRGKVHETILNVATNIDAVNLPTLFLGLGAIIILLVVKKWNKRLPGPLIVVLFGMAAVYFLGLNEQGVKIIKEVPGGLPSFGVPLINGTNLLALLPVALTISFVGFMESIAVAKAIQAKHKNYQISANQELIGLGLANIIGSFFKAFPVTGGFSRTAVNDQAGAKTGLASIISAVLIIVTLLFLTKYFYFLPNAILAAIIMVAVFGLIDFAEAKHLWKYDKKDFLVFMITALATLGLGIEEGILIGVVLSLGLLIYKVSYPHIAELGNVPESKEFRNIERFSDLETYEGILILRFDAQLYFANATSLVDFIYKKIKVKPGVRHIVLDCSAISSLDSSAVHTFQDLVRDLENKDIQLYFSHVIGPVRDALRLNGVLKQENMEHFYLSTADAVNSIRYQAENDFEDYAAQTS